MTVDQTGTSAFDNAPPAFDPSVLANLAAKHFGKAGDIKELASERDQNSLVGASKDGASVLKISNIAQNPKALEFQNAALDHLLIVAPHLNAPIAQRSLSGQSIITSDETGDHLVRLLSFVPGNLYSAAPRSTKLLENLGDFVGQLSVGLASFGHPGAHQSDFLWDLDQCHLSKIYIQNIKNSNNRNIVEQVFERHHKIVSPLLPFLRGAVIHNDANDNNLIVDEGLTSIKGIIDFGDMLYSRQINELAVTLAYALMGTEDAITDGATIVAAYHKRFPLTDNEFRVLPVLVAMRLAMSVCISSNRASQYPDNQYLTISQQPAFELLSRFDRINPHFLTCAWRKASGLSATPSARYVTNWLKKEAKPGSLFEFDMNTAARITMSMAEGAPGIEYLSDPVSHWAYLQKSMAKTDARYALGFYCEDRVCYQTDQFVPEEGGERRSVHLGIDVFIAAGTPLFAPLDGLVVSVHNNAIALDYGPTVILEHQAGKDGPLFYTLYGHLSLETLSTLSIGQYVEAGTQIGSIGNNTVNGGWAPHLHFQIITDLLGQSENFHGAGEPGRMDIWRDITPDPNLIMGLADEAFQPVGGSPQSLLEKRRDHLGPSLSVSYREPLKIVRGKGNYLIDYQGRHYLDLVNNISHVGHCHPHVVEALSKQASILNTNTRYLHDTIVKYAERLTATLPDPLSVCYFVNSGSEANELALRIARTVTGNHDIIAVDEGYHGNTGNLIDISAYKFNHKGGSGQQTHIKIAELPNPYRGRLKGYSYQSGEGYAESVADCISMLAKEGKSGPAAFIAESMPGCGGQIVLPDGYLKSAYAHARNAGALCIADEVQVGFGRDGEHFWAFEYQNVVPDIIVMGKPMGNGHPLAAVVTTTEIANSFANGMEYFNSFGGNPVSCAVGMAVLDVIENEKLQENAKQVGQHLLEQLKAFSEKHELIGDVRGRGFYIGAELVEDRETLAPATEKAEVIINLLKERSILLSSDGPLNNVLKIKPPMTFSIDHADHFLHQLDEVLSSVS